MLFVEFELVYIAAETLVIIWLEARLIGNNLRPILIGYNSAENESIRMKSGALYEYIRGGWT